MAEFNPGLAEIRPERADEADNADRAHKVDVYGCVRLLLFILRHPIATYRFVSDARCAFRSFTTDVYGDTAPLWSDPEIRIGSYDNRLRPCRDG